ncbi:MAG: hypothetical protein ACKOXN_02495, partial [Limnohabitans sp.]
GFVGIVTYGRDADKPGTINDTLHFGAESIVGDDTYETTLSLDRDVVQDLRILYMGQVAAKGR